MLAYIFFLKKNCGIHCLQQTGQRGGQEFEKRQKQMTML